MRNDPVVTYLLDVAEVDLQGTPFRIVDADPGRVDEGKNTFSNCQADFEFGE
jgi:hypothetical protein